MPPSDQCEVFCYDEEKVDRLKKQLMTEDIEQMTKMFKVLSDPTRMKIAFALCQEKELCVCDVGLIIGANKAVASHHLRTMRKMGLCKRRKEGKLVFYSLEDEHIRQLVKMAHEHSQHEHWGAS